MSPRLVDGTETTFAGCIWCKHLQGPEGPPRCTAFPDGIPPGIQIGHESHTKPRHDLGQDRNNEVVFEPIDRFDELYPDRLPPWDQRQEVPA